MVLPMDHPLAHDGVYLSCALVELAAQLAGRALGASTVARAGVLARLALSVGLPLLPQEPTILLWACGLGELDATGRFLGRLAEEGPGQLSAAT